MSDGVIRDALADVLPCLEQFVRDNVRPTEALARFTALRPAHPELTMELVWHASEYDSTIHYDALLRAPDVGTVSFGICPASDTPWPLRGARLASDQDLVRVNGETLKVRDAMDCIDFLWNEARIVTALVDLCLVAEAVKRLGIQPTADHTQRALDVFRSSRGLLSAAQTQAWMEANALTIEKLESMVLGQAETFALRDRVVEGADRLRFWHEHPGMFDVAHVARLRVRTRAHAEQLMAALAAGRDFYTVMEEEMVARRSVVLPRNPLAQLRRGDFIPEDADAIFGAAAGTVVGPLRAGDAYDVVRVIHTQAASLGDDATETALGDAIFDEWLAARRQEARIEWYWGPAR